jgi:hypothetical protein
MRGLWFVAVLDPVSRADRLDANTYKPTVGDWDGTNWDVGQGAFVLTYTAP